MNAGSLAEQNTSKTSNPKPEKEFLWINNKFLLDPGMQIAAIFNANVYGISDKNDTIKEPPPLMPRVAISFFSSEALSMLLPFLHAVIADE